MTSETLVLTQFIKTLLILLLALSAYSCTPSAVSTRQAYGSDYSHHEKWRAAELRKMASQDKPDYRRMMWLINRASAERDASFLDLLDREDLKKNRAIRMSLYGYDYAITGSVRALDSLILEDSKDPRGGDTSGILVVSFLNEWDKTIRMIKTHEAQADGAGGLAVASFWETRQHFYPQRTRRFRRVDIQN